MKVFTNNLFQDYIMYNTIENNIFYISNLLAFEKNYFKELKLELDNNIIDLDISEDKSFICFLIKNKAIGFDIKILKNLKTKI